MASNITTVEEFDRITEAMTAIAGEMMVIADLVDPTAECEFRRGFIAMNLALMSEIQQWKPDVPGFVIETLSEPWACTCGAHIEDSISSFLSVLFADTDSEEE